MILPAVAVLLALGVGVVQLGSVQVALTDAAADAARILGRGDAEGVAASRVAEAQPGARMSVDHLGSLVCVTASAEVSPGLLGSLFSFEGRGCALDDTVMPTAEVASVPSPRRAPTSPVGEASPRSSATSAGAGASPVSL